MARENVLGREKLKNRQMKLLLRDYQVAFQEKMGERSMLNRKKQGLLAKEAAKKKFVDEFMVFITATENNDLEIAPNFDEKAMMNTIATMIKSDAGGNGGFVGCFGDNNLLGIDLSVEEKAAIDAIVALENGVGSSEGDNGGFASGYDKNLAGIDLGLEKKATMDAIVALKNGVGSCGGDNGGFTGSHGRINNAPKNAHNGEEDKMTATEETKCDGGEGSKAGGHGGN